MPRWQIKWMCVGLVAATSLVGCRHVNHRRKSTAEPGPRVYAPAPASTLTPALPPGEPIGPEFAPVPEPIPDPGAPTPEGTRERPNRLPSPPPLPGFGSRNGTVPRAVSSQGQTPPQAEWQVPGPPGEEPAPTPMTPIPRLAERFDDHSGVYLSPVEPILDDDPFEETQRPQFAPFPSQNSEATQPRTAPAEDPRLPVFVPEPLDPPEEVPTLVDPSEASLKKTPKITPAARFRVIPSQTVRNGWR